jgi:hypothetical protein
MSRAGRLIPITQLRLSLAHDPSQLGHGYRELLPLADLVLTDRPAVARLTRAGLPHARPANLYGLDRHLLAEIDAPEGDRDIDVLFVGNLHPAVQGERLRWLGRLARPADQCRVPIASRVFGADYRALVRRAKGRTRSWRWWRTCACCGCWRSGPQPDA